MMKKSTSPPIGAKEKIRQATERWQSENTEDSQPSLEQKTKDTLSILIALWAVACSLALVLMQFSYPKGLPFQLPDPGLHALLVRMPPPLFVNDKDLNILIAMAIRGSFLFILTGTIPLLTHMTYRLGIGRHSPQAPLWLFWILTTLLLAGGIILHDL